MPAIATSARRIFLLRELILGKPKESLDLKEAAVCASNGHSAQNRRTWQSGDPQGNPSDAADPRGRPAADSVGRGAERANAAGAAGRSD